MDDLIVGESNYVQYKRNTNEWIKYERMISLRWNYPLPVLTKNGNLSYHRTGIRKGKVRLKENLMWEKSYNANYINIDEGFWANPFLERAKMLAILGDDPVYPEKDYLDWLHDSPEGNKRLMKSHHLKLKYLATNDLLTRPLGINDPIQHHGQILLLVRNCNLYHKPLNFVPLQERWHVLEPTMDNLKDFYYTQLGICPLQ